MIQPNHFLSLAFFALSVAAVAAPPADCGSFVNFGSNGVTYQSKAQFPDPSITVTLNFFDAKPVAALTICGFSFSADRAARVLTVKATRLQQFSSALHIGYAFNDDGKLNIENVYRDVNLGRNEPPSGVVFDPKTYVLTYQLPRSQSATFAVGVKVDGGPLRPLYYEGKGSTYTIPRSASVVDLYVNPGPNTVTSWQRVTLDLKRATLRFYKKAGFPQS